jgi:hypothetical protein
MSQKSSYNPEIPYNDLPLLPPGTEIENTAILKRLLRQAGHYLN